VLDRQNAAEDLSTPETEDTYEFTLVNLTKDFAFDQRKHIYLDAPNDDIELRFLLLVQKLAITTASNATCYELDMTAIPPLIIGTKVHVLTVRSMNCTIYSTQPIKICTLDFTLPEVKDAPRGDRKVLIQYLREHCNDYLDFAPDAFKYRMLLGLVKPKTCSAR
jgi:hypothetical protein